MYDPVCSSFYTARLTIRCLSICRRPQSAYVKYLQDTRPKVVKDNPDLKQTEIMAKIGNLWSALPEAKKKK